jgi:hypothetical protein
LKPLTLEQQMAHMGFPETETGPCVTALRAHIAKQLEAGMVMRSAGSWSEAGLALSHEDRAREILAFDWAVERCHTYRVKCFDRPVWWQWDFSGPLPVMRFRVSWRSIPAWVGDRFREFGCRYRVWRDRKLVNPWR